MKAGRLRYSVAIQQQASTKNSRGEFDDTWTTLANRRASIEPINGKEFWSKSGEHSDVDTRIRIRWDISLRLVKPKDRISHTDSASPQATTIYDIQSVIRPKETERELILMCVRRNP